MLYAICYALFSVCCMLCAFMCAVLIDVCSVYFSMLSYVLEFPFLLRAERPDDVTGKTKNLESQFAEFQNFQKNIYFK